MIKQQTNNPAKATKSKVKKTLRENIEYIFMAIPGFIHIILFCYLPMFGLIIAFKNINYADGIFNSPWAGLKNFEFLFRNPDVFIVMRNTLGYNLVFIVLGLVIPVLFAILLTQMRNPLLSKIYQSMMFLPHFLSWVIVSYIVFAFLDYNLGMINESILRPLGLEGTRWYQSPQYWPWILVFLHVWKVTGYNTVMYVASIAGIDEQLYEAAAIDGANKFQQAIYVTIPSLSNIMIILTILAVGKIFNSDFGMFYNVPMNSGILLPVTNTVDTFVYNALKVSGDIGMSSAAGLIQSIVGFVLVFVTNKIVSKIDDTKAMF